MYQENILFDSKGIPRISGFEASSVIFDPSPDDASIQLFLRRSLRWAAPERLEAKLDDEAIWPTKMSDVYTFGMVVVEVGCDRYPRRLESLTLPVRLLPGDIPSQTIPICRSSSWW